MKVRNGFVSNSSSASFIIKLNTSLGDEEIYRLIRKSDDWLDKYWDGGETEQWDLSEGFTNRKPKTKIVKKDPVSKEVYKRINDSTIEINLFTSMFNDWMDVPAWPFIRAVNEGKIKDLNLVEIIQTEDEYMSCNDIVEFNFKTWELQDQFESYNAAQNKVELEYQGYLISIGYVPTEEEIVEFTKNQLNQ